MTPQLTNARKIIKIEESIEESIGSVIVIDFNQGRVKIIQPLKPCNLEKYCALPDCAATVID